jgi:hypothetical protein
MQLQAVLPRFTNLFSDEFAVSSLSYAAGVVTCVTTAPHGFSTGDQVVTVGAKTPFELANLSSIDGVASAETVNDHDLTIEPFAQQIEIDGANEADYNGQHTLLGVQNRRNFTYEIVDTAPSPATGTAFLLSDFNQGYNGLHTITVADPTTFTYPIPETPESPAQGDIVVRATKRISGDVTPQHAAAAYTKQNDGQFWAFVILGDVATSKDRNVFSDATNQQAAGNVFRVRLIHPFSVYVFAPSSEYISGRFVRDQMEDLTAPLFRSLTGVKFPSNLCEQNWSMVTPVGHALVTYEGAYYVHRFDFESVTDVTQGDTAINDGLNVAFRDIHIDYLNAISNNGNIIMTSDVDLDEEPLG